MRGTYTFLRRKTSDLGCDCLNWRLLDDTHLMENYEIKAIDLRKHQPLGAASKAIQHTHFTERLYGIAKASMSFSSFTRRTLKE